MRSIDTFAAETINQTIEDRNMADSVVRKASSERNKKSEKQKTKTLTPPDQIRGTEKDVELTRRIRELVTKEDNLSVATQNVKIITLSGIATLRGQVATDQERVRVARIASDVFGGSNFVRDQLEVKAEKVTE